MLLIGQKKKKKSTDITDLDLLLTLQFTKVDDQIMLKLKEG